MKIRLLVGIVLMSMLLSGERAGALNSSRENNDDGQECRPQPAQPFGVEPAIPNPFDNSLQRYKPVPPPVTYDLKPLPQPSPSPL